MAAQQRRERPEAQSKPHGERGATVLKGFRITISRDPLVLLLTRFRHAENSALVDLLQAKGDGVEGERRNCRLLNTLAAARHSGNSRVMAGNAPRNLRSGHRQNGDYFFCRDSMCWLRLATRCWTSASCPPLIFQNRFPQIGIS